MRYFTIAVLLFLCSFANAQQNLVPNPSFEDTLNCNLNQYTPNAAFPWFNPTISTPDYYSTFGNCGITPAQSGDYQQARTGSAYCGIFTSGGNTREYIEVKLLDSLLVNKTYTLSFYVAKCALCPFATDRIGLLISKDSITDSTYFNIDTLPQIESPINIYLLDTINWMQISGNYLANGGEKYITIGNFRDSSNTNLLFTGGIANGAYYYIDDISVICQNCPVSILENSSSAMPIFSNPYSISNDNPIKLILKGNNAYIKMKIYDLIGRIIYEEKIYVKGAQINYSIPTKIKEGNYILQISTLRDSHSYHLIITP